jgi:hypothetical protein
LAVVADTFNLNVEALEAACGVVVKQDGRVVVEQPEVLFAQLPAVTDADVYLG